MVAGAMARKPRNPINDISNVVGGWLGGRGPGTNPQVQAAMQATRAVARTADTATGGFGSALLSDAQRMAMSGSSTPSALYKTAAVNLAAAATGVGAARVAGKVVQSGRVVNPVAAAKNKVTGREVWIHSSPVGNLRQVNPVVSPKGRPRYQKDTPLTFGTRASQKGTQEYLPEYVREVTTKYNPRGNVGTAGRPQSIYVTSVRKKDVVAYEAAGKWGVSSGPQKVVSEIRIGSKTPDQLTREISSAVRKAGESFKPQYSKAELARMELRAKLARIKNPPPPKNRKKID
jgi:hypothetical protein